VESLPFPVTVVIGRWRTTLVIMPLLMAMGCLSQSGVGAIDSAKNLAGKRPNFPHKKTLADPAAERVNLLAFFAKKRREERVLPIGIFGSEFCLLTGRLVRLFSGEMFANFWSKRPRLMRGPLTVKLRGEFLQFFRRKTAKKSHENSYWNPEVGDRLPDRPKAGSIYGGDIARQCSGVDDLNPTIECPGTARTVRTRVSGPAAKPVNRSRQEKSTFFQQNCRRYSAQPTFKCPDTARTRLDTGPDSQKRGPDSPDSPDTGH